MHVTMIVGSRSEEGQTARAAKALAEGLAAGGADVESFYLPSMRIERCRQCDDKGWGTCRSEGRCTVDDDFARLVDGLRAADAAVFATPVYFSDLSESLRAFLDRLRRVTRHESGRCGLDGKRAVGVCVAGGGGGGAPECIVHLEKTLRTSGFDVVDLVPVRRQNLGMKLEVLRHTGEWLAKGAPE